jgi:hypothetical protein
VHGPGPPHVHVTDICRSLGFYLDLSCDVREAADGWALLRCGQVELVLVHIRVLGHERIPTAPVARLLTCDVRAVRRRLAADGVPVGPLIRPAGSAGEFEAIDPDLNRLVIEQVGTSRGTQSPVVGRDRSVPRSPAHPIAAARMSSAAPK